MIKSFSKFNHYLLRNKKRFFGDVVPSSSSTPVPQVTKGSLEEFAKVVLELKPEQISQANKIGADLFLSPEKLEAVKTLGLFYEDVNPNINIQEHAKKGWKYTYLNNMLMFQNYNSLFREFLQSCCTYDYNGLNLVCEERLRDYTAYNINELRSKFGYNLEIESLKIMQNYKILRMEIYKNLYVTRSKNKTLHDYSFKYYPTPLAPMIVANQQGEDTSIATMNHPFILATTMLIQTPMKVAVLNQNMKKKVHGHSEDQMINYVVRFESQFNLFDFFWALPTQNKPNRLRRTVITDFNNVLRGNPYFHEKFDLINDGARFTYMSKDEAQDKKVSQMFKQTPEEA